MRWGLWLAALALALVAAIGLVGQFAGERPTAAGTNLPWQSDVDAQGRVSVFGFTLGSTTLGEVLPRLGSAVELAIFIQPDGQRTLEAYFREVELGGLTAKLILQLQASPETFETLLTHADPKSAKPQPSGAMQVTPSPQDDHVLLGLPVAGITYAPSARLDMDTLRQRFGEPEQRRVQGEEGEHWLYPARGIDIWRAASGKTVLQYVNPADFARLQASGAASIH
ncbi:hypothetical protein [Plasticicumulans acidivorans]|uniref:Uncharacterized protein n=1 Tax=Plasticicumulans acidivorans TaxID=886464 RepID=A0A317MVC5_9GAMM|nr:hypothetical protein [Plasticicumulans acidivorans]PWV61581.1 hypothetical protein C7443_1059 [Plasticicumulans acidivorans]